MPALDGCSIFSSPNFYTGGIRQSQRREPCMAVAHAEWLKQMRSCISKIQETLQADARPISPHQSLRLRTQLPRLRHLYQTLRTISARLLPTETDVNVSTHSACSMSSAHSSLCNSNFTLSYVHAHGLHGTCVYEQPTGQLFPSLNHLEGDTSHDRGTTRGWLSIGFVSNKKALRIAFS